VPGRAAALVSHSTKAISAKAAIDTSAADRRILRTRGILQLGLVDYAVAIEHDRIAVRLELTWLWLLFIPTFAAIAFLLMTAASGTTWNVNLFGSLRWGWINTGPYPVLMFFRMLVVGVFGLLSAWLTERWVLRDASACSAGPLQSSGHKILYSFQDPSGEYYGGEGFPFGSILPQNWELLSSTTRSNLTSARLQCAAYSIGQW
jgi:hypothetical protein